MPFPNPAGMPTKMFRVIRKSSSPAKFQQLRTKNFTETMWALSHLRNLRNDGAPDSELWIGEVKWRKVSEAELKKLQNEL